MKKPKPSARSQCLELIVFHIIFTIYVRTSAQSHGDAVDGKQRLLGLEEALLGRLLFYSDLDVRVLRRMAVVAAGNNTAQPLVAVVLLFGVKVMVGAVLPMRRVDTVVAFRLAPAK